MSSTAPSSSSGASPVWILILSVFGLAMWVFVTLLQIQSSENLISHTYTGVVPSIRILQQWPDAINGHMSTTGIAAFIYGWGIEILVLFFVSAYEFVRHATRNAHPVIAKVFLFALFAACIMDFASDYNYISPSVGIWVRLGYALFSAAIVAFLGLACVAGLTYAFKHW